MKLLSANGEQEVRIKGNNIYFNAEDDIPNDIILKYRGVDESGEFEVNTPVMSLKDGSFAIATMGDEVQLLSLTVGDITFTPAKDQ